MKRRMISAILVLAMLLSMFVTPFYAFAETGDCTITVETVDANPDSTVDVNVSIKNNPGILGATLKVSWDNRLSLVSSQNGEAFSALDLTASKKNGGNFVWYKTDIADEDIQDGVILTLTYSVPADVDEGAFLNVSVSYEDGDINDKNLESVYPTITTGGVNVVSYTPGDVNDDGKINTMDLILISRYIADGCTTDPEGYNVSLNVKAANVNGDTKINTIDLIWISRYIADGCTTDPDGYNIKFVSSKPQCVHSMIKTDAVAATCTEDGNIEYWTCEKCHKLFRNENGTNEITPEDRVISATGHTEEIDPYVAPTYDSVGYTEGAHCSVCGTVLRARTEIPKLEKNEYYIRYNINNEYLETKNIDMPSQTTYTSEEGIATLTNIHADGYTFDGWYDGPGSTATKVTSIPVGSTGNKELYAHWTTKSYTIQFDSPLAPVESKTYTVSQGATLSNPEWFGYTFVGWSDDEGNLVERIMPGTTGDITLHANWTSIRNQTVPVQSLGDPIIYEDSENGQYLFAYELGRIENVPLFTIKSFGNSNGITITETTSTSGSISSTSASSIANMIAETTTRSDSWSLSEAWSDSTTISQEHAIEVSSSVINSATSSFNETGKWSISGGTGGTTSNTTENGISGKVSAKVGYEAEAGVKAGPVTASAKVSGEVGAEVGTTHQDSTTNSRNWNTTQGYEGSTNSSRSSSSSSSFGKAVSDRSGYAQTKAHNKGTNETKTYALSNTSSREYTSSLSYAESTTETSTRTYSNANAPAGWYRLVAAGTVHVFGVVGYDIATRSYYTFTYSIIDDDIYDFVDYSKNTQQFNDYENGVLPFDVPYEVNEYIDDVLFQSAGLVVDIDTGKVVTYTGDATSVYVPEYMPVDNGDGTTTVVKVTGFEPNAFDNGKTSIKYIKFSKYVTEIPDNAFKDFNALEKINAPAVTTIGNNSFSGCTSLETIDMPNVETIGKRAFQNCSSITDYVVSEKVTELGEKAFDGAGRVSVKAVNSGVAESAVYSGATQIIITNSADKAILENKIIVVPEGTEYFEFNGANKTYNNLRIESNAATTVINNAILECTSGVPLKLSSENVTLNRLTVDAPEYTMILSADLTTVSLFGTINLDTSGTNSVLSKNIKLVQANPQAVGKLHVSGNVMICREITNRDLLTVSNGEVIFIDEDTYNTLAIGSLDWVLESEMPLGATVVGQKWTYDLTTTKTSSNQTEAGYELYNTTWTWGSYGNWSGWQDGYVAGSDSRQVETRSVENYTETYLYNYYNSSKGTTSLDNLGSGYAENGYWVRSSAVYQWNPYSSRVGYITDSLKAAWNYPFNKGSNRTIYKTQYRYRDRSKVYTYHHKRVEHLESSTEITESSASNSNESISNIQKWVQYVMN